jgi:hypothetical protein
LQLHLFSLWVLLFHIYHQFINLEQWTCEFYSSLGWLPQIKWKSRNQKNHLIFYYPEVSVRKCKKQCTCLWIRNDTEQRNYADLLINCVPPSLSLTPCTLLYMGIQIFLMALPTLGAISICVGLQWVLSLTFIKLACKYDLSMDFV